MNTTRTLLTVLLVLLSMVLTFGGSAFAGNTYYVSTSGDNSYDGLTEATAWASIDWADNHGWLSAGDTIKVKAGTYNVDRVKIWGAGGTSIAPVTYQSYGGEVIINAPSSTEYAWEMYNMHNVVIDGFKLTGAQGGLLSVATHNIEFMNCTVYGLQSPYRHEVYIANGSGGWNFHNNILNSASDHAVFISQLGAGNKFYNNTLKLLSTQWAFLLADGVYASVDPINTGLEIKNNIIWSPEGHAIYQTAPFSMVHQNNLYWSDSGAGWQWAGESSADPSERFLNPLFVDAVAGDFRLATGSPAIDTGLIVGLPYNILPDIGAFESTAVPEPCALLGLALGLVGLITRPRGSKS